MRLHLRLLSALCWLALVFADTADNITTFPEDPYLKYKPEFARSLPVQTLVTGVVFTLTSVLLVHILFTGQYHWPLAPVNYALQFSGVIVLLISLIATIRVILASAVEESKHWPYMLTYMAVNVPPLDMLNVDDVAAAKVSLNDLPPPQSMWSASERGTWLMMNAAVSALVQITHIQFLTLLYPSRLEGRLIYSLLGPLAIIAATMQLIPIQQSNLALINIANDIRNVCNATLSLLFTSSLFIWGLLVNRSQAWRTDGGTAVFGVGALGLALVSTALNVLYIPKNEEYVWLPGVIWAVILWQSFLGWWWWVGAGSGQAMTTDDIVNHIIKKGEERKRKRREKKEERERDGRKKSESREGQGHNSSDGDHTETPGLPVRPTARRTESSCSTTTVSTLANETATTTSSTSSSTLGAQFRFLPQAVHVWYHNIRQAHVTAAMRQTVERAERIREIEGRVQRANLGRPRDRFTGWGLGSFWWRVAREESEQAQIQAQARGADCEKELPRRRSRRKMTNHSGSEDEPEEGQEEPRIPRPTTNRKAEKGSSIWWWGPLNKWRLQDSTSYR